MRKKNNRYRSKPRSRRGFIRGMLKHVFAVAFGAAIVFFLSAGLARSYYKLLDAPWLRITEIQTSGLKHMERREMLNVLQVPRGESVLNIKTSELAARVEALAWVKSSVVRLDLPGRLVVEVKEREPIAIVQTDDALILLDSDGKLFAKVDAESHPDLLRVTGLGGGKLGTGAYMPSEPFLALRDLLPALEKCKGWLPVQMISQCQWHEESGFILFTAQEVPILLGFEDYVIKLERLRQVFSMLGDRQWLDGVRRIDLDYSNRVYIEGEFPISSKGS